MDELLTKLLNEDEFEDTFKPADKSELSKRAEVVKNELKNGSIPKEIKIGVSNMAGDIFNDAMGELYKQLQRKYPGFYDEIWEHEDINNILNSEWERVTNFG